MSYCNQIWSFWTDFHRRSNIKFHGNRSVRAALTVEIDERIRRRDAEIIGAFRDCANVLRMKYGRPIRGNLPTPPLLSNKRTGASITDYIRHCLQLVRVLYWSKMCCKYCTPGRHITDRTSMSAHIYVTSPTPPDVVLCTV
jgi:hypothetical protein